MCRPPSGQALSYCIVFAGRIVLNRDIVSGRYFKDGTCPLVTVPLRYRAVAPGRYFKGGPSISHAQILSSPPLFFKMACKQNLDLRCVFISDPCTLGC